MTKEEFKAWFEGFSENIDGVPSNKQWARIKERIGQIDGKELTSKVIHEYWPRWSYTTVPNWNWSSAQTFPLYTTTSNVQPNTTAGTAYTLSDMGRNEAKTLS